MNSKEALGDIRDYHNETVIDNYCTYTENMFEKELDIIEKDLDRLEEYRKIEKELGVDLIPILTMLIRGYAFWKYDNFIYKVQVDNITNCCLKVNTWYYGNYNKNGKRYGDEFTIDFKEYGKNLALTKEELEFNENGN